jgi:flagellar hook-length control protein FliK
METNRIDLAFALANKNNQTKSAGTSNNGAFADMLLGAMGQKASAVGTDKSQVKPAETYNPRRRFDDYTPNQFNMRDNAGDHTDSRVENSQSRSRWSVDDTSSNPGRGPTERAEHVANHPRVARGQGADQAQQDEVADVGADSAVDPASDIEAPEGDQDATVGGEDCGKQESGSDTDSPDTPVIVATTPAVLPEELPAVTELAPGVTGVAAAAPTGAAGTAPVDGASPDDIAEAAALAATATLPQAAAVSDTQEEAGTSGSNGDTAKPAGDETARQGVNFSATLALTDTADDVEAQAAGQANAIAARNEQQLEDAGTSFRRNPAGTRRNPGNGAGTTGAQNSTSQQPAAAAAAATEAPAANAAAPSTVAPATGLAPIGFDTGLGNSAGLPGWNLHLAQGAAARRGDFVANLRQHLQNLPVQEQVALSIQRSLRDGGGNITLQLSPSELGRIHLKLKIDEENNVQASVVVERPATLELLQRDMKALERALQEAGLKAGPGDLSFSLQGGDTEAFAREFGSGGGNGSGTGHNNGADSTEDALAAIATPVVDTADGWVDVQV